MDCRVRPGNDDVVGRVPVPQVVIPGLDPGIHSDAPRAYV